MSFFYALTFGNQYLRNLNTITLQTATTVNRGGLLNFELMGVNLSGFVLALFSLSILIVVIKFALGNR